MNPGDFDSETPIRTGCCPGTNRKGNPMFHKVRYLLGAVTLAGVFFLLPRLSNAADNSTTGTRPLNIVFLVVDDLGWTDLGCYGADLHETPRIDRLAQQGMRFTDAYAAAPVCSPTRASILTGNGMNTPVSAIRQGDWKLMEYFEDGRLELYNLATDVGEKNDLYASRPKLAKKLQSQLRDWRHTIDAALPTPNPVWKPPRSQP